MGLEITFAKVNYDFPMKERIQLCPMHIAQKWSRAGVPGSSSRPVSRIIQGRNQTGKNPSSFLCVAWRHNAVNKASWMAEEPQIRLASPPPMKRTRVYRRGKMVVVRTERARKATVPHRRSWHGPTSSWRATLTSRDSSSSWLRAYRRTSEEIGGDGVLHALIWLKHWNTRLHRRVTSEPWEVSVWTQAETCLDASNIHQQRKCYPWRSSQTESRAIWSKPIPHWQHAAEHCIKTSWSLSTHRPLPPLW